MGKAGTEWSKGRKCIGCKYFEGVGKEKVPYAGRYKKLGVRIKDSLCGCRRDASTGAIVLTNFGGEQMARVEDTDRWSLDFTTINVDGAYREWSFTDIEVLRKAYHSEEVDVPMLDDPVADMEFCGVPMYVDNFGDIVRLFGIEEE